MQQDKRLKCKTEGCYGTVVLDSDSYEVNCESTTEDGGLELSAKVTGYCDICETEHIYSIQGYADIKTK